MAIYQCLRLVPLELPRILRVSPKITSLKRLPVELIEIRQVRIEIRVVQVRVAVGKNKLPVEVDQRLQRRHENNNSSFERWVMSL